MLSTVTTAKKSAKKSAKKKAKPEPDGRPMSKLTEVGDAARKKAVRDLLLKTLKEHDWNLTATAEALGTFRPGVIRALLEVAPDEYEKAKTDGRVSAGNRRT